jgi:hypothetical protein
LDPTQFLARIAQATSIPGADAVVLLPYQNAKHCLVHIRDYHVTPNMSAKSEAVVEAVQKDIRQILRSFMDAPEIRLRGVYTEGLTLEGEALARRAPKSGNQAGSRKADRGLGGLLASAFLGSDDGTRAQRSELSAVDWLHREAGLTKRAAETRQGNHAAAEILRQPLSSGNRLRGQRVLEDREDILLDIIAEKGDPVAVTVFGGFHDWSNNIQAWNKKHPDRKFALVEITPTAYAAHVINGRRLPRK